MAYDNFSEPAVEAAAFEGLRRERAFFNRVYGWMTLGLAITGGVAWYLAVVQHGWIAAHRGWYLFFVIAELALVFGLSAGIRKMAPAAAFGCFLLFSALNGATLSWIFLVYTANSVANAFLSTSLTFGVMGVYGWATKRDLTSLGAFCSMGLIGLIIASLINLFVGSGSFSFVISCIGILIFVGLTAYDTQKIKQLAFAVGDGLVAEEESRKLAILGALELYLDFINIFLYMLRFFGSRK